MISNYVLSIIIGFVVGYYFAKRRKVQVAEDITDAIAEFKISEKKRGEIIVPNKVEDRIKNAKEELSLGDIIEE